MTTVRFAWFAVLLAACGGAPAASAPAAAPPVGVPLGETVPAAAPSPSPAEATMSVPPAPLAEGDPAPDFEAVAQDGTSVRLSAMRGRLVVVYFYPKDETPGCTKEACELRDAWSELRAAGAVVIGVSLDDAASHKEFAAHHDLPFLLVSDGGGSICEAFGVHVSKGHAERTTFLIGADGRIRHVWTRVNPIGHAAEILAAIRGGGGA